MKLYLSVVAKQSNKWYIGFWNGTKFEKIREIKKLADVKNVADYKGLLTYLRTTGQDREQAKTILKKSKCDTMYVLNKPVELEPKQFEKYWWSDRFPKCKKCINDCKQSHMIKELRCKQFKKM